MSDAVIRELWRVKEEIAKEFNYDIAAMAAELNRRQEESGRPVVDLSRRRAEQPVAGADDLRPKT
jgi:hypothetical protein